MLYIKHDLLLKKSAVDLIVLNEDILPNRLDGIQLLVVLLFHKKDLTESATAKDHLELEVIERDLFLLGDCCPLFQELGGHQLVCLLRRQPSLLLFV